MVENVIENELGNRRVVNFVKIDHLLDFTLFIPFLSLLTPAKKITRNELDNRGIGQFSSKLTFL